MRCLGDRGRLLEIGKYDILKGAALSMRPLLRNIAFDGIDLDRVFNDADDTAEVCAPPSWHPHCSLSRLQLCFPPPPVHSPAAGTPQCCSSPAALKKNGVQIVALHKLMGEGILSGEVRPLPLTIFTHARAEEAFRFLATGVPPLLMASQHRCAHAPRKQAQLHSQITDRWYPYPACLQAPTSANA